MKRNSIYLIALALILLLLTGCLADYASEKIKCDGKTESEYDNTYIFAPDGYFLNGYEWVDVDDSTKHLIITMTKENTDG